MLQAFADEVENGFLPRQIHMPFADDEARRPQRIQHLAFRCRVAQEQFFAAREILRQGRFVKRVNGAIAVAELCPRHHIASIGRTVKIHARHQRQLNQLTAQLIGNLHQPGQFQERHKFTHHTRRLAHGIVEAALPAQLLLIQHAQHAALLLLHRHDVLPHQREGTGRQQRTEFLGEHGNDRQAVQVAGDAELQGDFPCAHRLDRNRLFPDLQAKRRVHQLAQDFLRERLRQRQITLFRAAQERASFLLCQTQRAQNLQNPLLHRAEAHPFRVKHEALAVLHRRLRVNGINHLWNRLDHIQAFFANQQANADTGRNLVAHGFEGQANLHVDGALLRQRAIHCRHQLRTGRFRLAAHHIAHCAFILTLDHCRHHMPARASFLVNRAAAAAFAVVGEYHIVHFAIRDLAAQALCALLHNMHCAAVIQPLAVTRFRFARQNAQGVGDLGHA